MATVYSSPGIATLCGHMSKLCVTNVVMKVTSLLVLMFSTVFATAPDLGSTGTGSRILKTSMSRLSSTEVTQAWVAMVNSSRTTGVLLVPALFPFPLETEVAASRVALSRSTNEIYLYTLSLLTQLQHTSKYRPDITWNAGIHRPGSRHHRLQPSLPAPRHQPVHSKEVVHHGELTKRYHRRGF
jgi:hypothetical protein